MKKKIKRGKKVKKGKTEMETKLSYIRPVGGVLTLSQSAHKLQDELSFSVKVYFPRNE